MLKKVKSLGKRLLGTKSETDYYGQAGEDAIVWNIVSSILKIKKGFYIDIGAYHPFKHSNTFLLYKAGWHGINIDPAYGMKKLFDYYRPNDINIEAGIAEQNTEMTYYILKEGSTMNSFSKENLERLGVIDQVTRTASVPVYRLDYLLRQYPAVNKIDYLNIDAEGFEMEVLSTVDYEKHSPSVISIEQNNVLALKDVLNSKPCEFLASNQYSPIAKNIVLKDVSTVFYVLDKYLTNNIYE